MTDIGLMVEGQWGLTWERWRKLLQAAEDFGYQCVFRSDHYTIGPPDMESLETWISLTYAATQTRRIEFGPLVSPVTFRQPILTARMAAQVDDLSGGRLVLGLGAGWHEREHRQFGIPFYDRRTRFEMFEDALEITTRLYKSEEPVTYQGRHFSLEEAVLLPRPQRAGGPPILIGGKGKRRTLPLAAKYADEWNVPHVSPAEYRELNNYLTELLEQEGRDPRSVKRSLMAQVIYGRTEAEVREKQERLNRTQTHLVGVGSQLVDLLGEYVDAGVERFMLMWIDQDDIAGLESMARDVLPHFHG
ncbi:MAG: LLM class F420-dependent oxidoreductase [Chloroflexota bacterium]|nr:MAG: LLM class F420-dependent oxidoreductase [Chloroflexota bacterium]